MPTSLIIGTGPAAAGAALALAADPEEQITVLDIGGLLEPERVIARDLLASVDESEWPEDAFRMISHPPVVGNGKSLPEKRTYGSDYPFRNVGQLEGIRAIGGANENVVSGAYGGFSNAWGAQIMPFTAATFDRWPISADEMAPHYRFALNEMEFSGAEDDLSVLFPLLATPRPLPRLADRTRRVLDRYEAQRAQLQAIGITVGRARLALRSEECTRCALCMSGCPYGLIYSSSHSFDRLRADGRITYLGNLLAIELTELDSVPQVTVRNLNSGGIEHLSADRIYVACGAIGTTRLILSSLGLFSQPVHLDEAMQFVMPFASVHPTVDPRNEKNFTLNQFNVLFDASGDGFDLCQIHLYPYNPVFLSSLPEVLQRPTTQPLTTALLRRLSVGLGYLPSWASPTVTITARARAGGVLPNIEIEREHSHGWPSMLRRFVSSLLRAAPALDLWPLLPKATVSPAAKSYHFGGSFPHGKIRKGLTTDRLGRLDKWEHIYIIDASVFPNIPATTFSLTIMANAHRIASETLRSRR